MIPFPRRSPRAESDEPTELRVSDFEIVQLPREPTNPCIAFERTFSAGLQGLASMPARRARALPLDDGEDDEPTLPPSTTAPRAGEAAPRRRAVLPWAAALLLLGIAAAVFADHRASGHLLAAVASLIDPWLVAR